MLGTILLVLLVLVLLGAVGSLPAWGHSRAGATFPAVGWD